MSCHALLPGIFRTRGWNPHLLRLLHWQVGSLPQAPLGSPPNLYTLWASLVSQMVKNLPAIQETQVRSLGWEDSLEKGMATHSSILARRIPRTD